MYLCRRAEENHLREEYSEFQQTFRFGSTEFNPPELREIGKDVLVENIVIQRTVAMET